MTAKKTPEQKEAAKAEAKKAKGGASLGGAKPKDATKAHVSIGGERIRTYTVETHGEGFADLAKEFAGKVEGRKVVLE